MHHRCKLQASAQLPQLADSGLDCGSAGPGSSATPSALLQCDRAPPAQQHQSPAGGLRLDAEPARMVVSTADEAGLRSRPVADELEVR